MTLYNRPGSPRRCGNNPARGVDYLPLGDGRSVAGTSPRTRGRRPGARGLLRQQRNIPAHCTRGRRDGRRPARPVGGNIPAHAGSTRGLSSALRPSGEHPRARGVDSVSTAAWIWLSGASPRTRGLRLEVGDHDVVRRSIPAHAGLTSCAPDIPAPRPEHPRVRGVDQRTPDCTARRSGASPRTRGRQRLDAGKHPHQRSIPAHAGRLLRLDVQPAEDGSIPAHAGSIGIPTRTPTASWEHPRARGVDSSATTRHPARTGASPRTRGR